MGVCGVCIDVFYLPLYVHRCVFVCESVKYTCVFVEGC